ncbi:MAG: hypothetical protein EXR79_09750 [Myxococcales bacterium]|nr:hypothetical protein [Myxococcales bacterium]
MAGQGKGKCPGLAAACAVWGAVLAGGVGCSEEAPAATPDADGGASVQFGLDLGKVADTKGKDAGSASSATVDAAPDAGSLGDDAAPEEVLEDSAGIDGASPADTTTDDAAAPPEDVSPSACTPKCGIKLCGPDGCGGSCGDCTETQQCQVGKCVTKSNLGCAGLALKENWAGKFKGDCTFVAAGGLVPVKAKTSGDMTFKIKCFNSKYLVSGEMVGEASGNKFTLQLSGTYDPTPLKLVGSLNQGNILLWKLFEYKFEGPIEGTLGADGTFTGTWKVDSTDVKFLGQPSPTTPPFKAEGTWSATGS